MWRCCSVAHFRRGRSESHREHRDAKDVCAQGKRALTVRTVQVSTPSIKPSRSASKPCNNRKILPTKTRSKTEYENFFILWKDADSDLPVLQQAHWELMAPILKKVTQPNELGNWLLP